MAIWLVRAGSNGEREDLVLDGDAVVIGWDEMPDLSTIEEWDELKRKLREVYSGKKEGTISNWAGQLWAFSKSIKKDDLIVLPLKRQSGIAIGRASGSYQYDAGAPEGAKHQMKVKWIHKELARERFSQDLLYSFGAFMTVCRIQRNNAEERISSIVEGREIRLTEADSIAASASDETAPIDLEEYAATQLKTYIQQEFKGHRFAHLIGELLKAQGYQIELSPPGPDGGVDIIAGRGPLGFESPRLCVQVKSGGQVDVGVLRSLIGTMDAFGADQGLLVSMDGFKRSVMKESRQSYFKIRRWDINDVLEAIQNNYERLPEDIQSELPLKRVWALVQGQ